MESGRLLWVLAGRCTGLMFRSLQLLQVFPSEGQELTADGTLSPALPRGRCFPNPSRSLPGPSGDQGQSTGFKPCTTPTATAPSRLALCNVMTP